MPGYSQPQLSNSQSFRTQYLINNPTQSPAQTNLKFNLIQDLPWNPVNSHPNAYIEFIKHSCDPTLINSEPWKKKKRANFIY